MVGTRQMGLGACSNHNVTGMHTILCNLTHGRASRSLRRLSLGFVGSGKGKFSFVGTRTRGGTKSEVLRSSSEARGAEGHDIGRGWDWKLLLWSTLDVTATLGSIGGAVAFILTQEAILVGLPVVLPLLALYASKRRESIKVQVMLPTPRKSFPEG